MRFPHAPLGYELEANGPYPWGIIWDEDLSFILVFTPEKGKIYLGPPNIFSAPQSRCSGAGPVGKPGF